MNNPLQLIKVDADKYYWHTEQETDDGGWLLFKDGELIQSTQDEYEAHHYYDWALWGGSELIDGKLVEVKGLLDYPNTFEEQA